MKKIKMIKGMANTDDIVWFKIKPDKKTMDFLDSIFNLYSDYDVDDEISGIDNYRSYKSWLPMERIILNMKEEKTFVYLIFTPKTLHLVIRKTGNFREIVKKILNLFDFKKYTPTKRRRRK